MDDLAGSFTGGDIERVGHALRRGLDQFYGVGIADLLDIMIDDARGRISGIGIIDDVLEAAE